ncbi:MAG: cupin domain-containing protein [Bacteroidia bacterium]|nr:cupin domain-containing protein [Bacteroidia bacterium]
MKNLLASILIFPFLFQFHLVLAQPMLKDEKKKEISAVEIIESYVADYRKDRYAAEAMTFGIEIPEEGSWTVKVSGEKIGDEWEVLLTEGIPDTKTFIYKIESETLQGIYEGNLNALTAQGKAFSGDYTPMSIYMMEGFEPTMQEYNKINPFSFHFWTKGFPEIVPFGEGLTRKAHGSNFVVFYYEKGLRTAWYRVLPQEKVRHDPREQAMPFPMMVVGIKGTTEGEVDGKRVSLPAGNTLFIPPNVHHKWWNETDEATEAILIMFGDGA